MGHRWWAPNPGPQAEFLACSTFEVLYGGAAGGGKSTAILAESTRGIGVGYGRNYTGLILRRTYPELEKTIIAKARDFYPQLGGVYNEGKKRWVFPGGESIVFGHMEHADDVEEYLGGDYQFVAFEELTTFLQSQYVKLIARIRSAYDVPLSLRATTNPGSEGHEWVFKRWGPWLDPDAPIKAKTGHALYFFNDDSGTDTIVPKGTELALGRTFIPAQLEDNPYLAADGVYASALQQLDPVTRKRMRHGDWLVKPAAGLYFKREWMHFIEPDEVPKDLLVVRYWDRAATDPEEQKRKGKTDPDWSVGAKLGMKPDKSAVYVLDVARMRGEPGAVEKFIISTAEMDGKGIEIGLEQEPGASGKADVAHLIQMLRGFRAFAHPKRNNKIVAAGPISADCQNEKLYVVRAPWNDRYIAELEQFPEGDHDDQVDGSSGAHTVLTSKPLPRKPQTKHGAFSSGVSFEDLTIGS